MRRLLVWTALLSLCGCMMGPDYRRPALDLPQSFRYAETDAREAANTAWWKAFQDPVLDRLVAEAVAQNKDLQVAAANVQQAAALLTQTRSSLFPQLGYGADASRQRASESSALPLPAGISNPYNSVQVLAGASWEIDLWGRVRRLSEAARAELLASEEGRRGVILSLVSSVAGGYLQLRALDEQLEIARRNLSTYEEAVKLFELQFRHGQVSQMVVEQARTQYETAAATIPQLEAQIAQNEHALSILLGRNPGAIPRGKPLALLAFPAVPSGLPSQLLERRPDLAEAELRLVAANARIGAAKALYFPTISLTGDYGYESSRLSGLFEGPGRIWSYAGSVTGPLFTAGAISGQVRLSEAAREAALVAYQGAIQRAFADVEDALVARQKLAVQIQAQERLVAASREYERLAKLQYDGGYVPYLTVLDAQQQLFPAELDLAQLRFSLYNAYVNLYKAMGGGWIAGADALASPAAAPAAPPQGGGGAP